MPVRALVAAVAVGFVRRQTSRPTSRVCSAAFLPNAKRVDPREYERPPGSGDRRGTDRLTRPLRAEKTLASDQQSIIELLSRAADQEALGTYPFHRQVAAAPSAM